MDFLKDLIEINNLDYLKDLAKEKKTRSRRNRTIYSKI